jgi:hypothetical protein
LHLSEPEAYLRIAVARASREHPLLLTMLSDGRLHLTGIGMLAPHLTRENRDGLLARATHKSKRQIEELIAEIAPRPDVAATVRKLPERRALPNDALLVAPNRGDDPMVASGPDTALGRDPDPTVELRPDGVDAPGSGVVALPARSPSVVEPLSPGRYKVQFTAGAEFQRKLERLRALSGVPGGDLAAVIEQAVTEKLERLEARRFARTKAPHDGRADTKTKETHPSPPSRNTFAESPIEAPPSSRHIPAAVRRSVYERDGGRCRYVDDQGRRCSERDQLEYHHGHPFGLGGGHDVANVRLMCRAHNAHLAQCDYGRKKMANHQRPRSRGSSPPAG